VQQQQGSDAYGFQLIMPARQVISPSSAAISELLPEPGAPTTTVS